MSAAPSPSSPEIGWKTITGAVVIALASFVVFAPTLHAAFEGDDSFYIVFNPLMQDPGRLWKAWFEPGSFIEYYPIEQSVQWFQWLIFKRDPFGYHACNLALHIGNSLLVWFFLSKLHLRFAWLGGLIYAVYPPFVDSVGSISELKNTLSAGPFLLSMCFYLEYEKERKSRDYLLSLALFLVAMLCKISMMFFPFVILLHAWYLRGKIGRRDLLACAPFLIISVILGALCLACGFIYSIRTHDILPGPILIGGFLSRTALVGLTLSFYFSHTLLPLTPLPLYPLWKIDPPSPWQFLPWLVFAAAGWFLWTKRKSWGRPIILGVGAFVLFLIPNLGFHNISYMCLSWVQDHFLYLPMIFLLALLLAGWEGIERLLPANQRAWIWLLPGLTVLLLAGETRSYSEIHSNLQRRFAYNAKYNPDSWFVRYCLGNNLLINGQIDQALPELELSTRLNPDFVLGHLSLGTCYVHLGNYAAAERHFREALRINPYVIRGYTGLGASLTLEGRFADAVGVFQKELKLDPADGQAHDGLGNALLGLGRRAEAIEQFKAALAIAPDDAFALQKLAAMKN